MQEFCRYVPANQDLARRKRPARRSKAAGSSAHSGLFLPSFGRKSQGLPATRLRPCDALSAVFFMNSDVAELFRSKFVMAQAAKFASRSAKHLLSSHAPAQGFLSSCSQISVRPFITHLLLYTTIKLFSTLCCNLLSLVVLQFTGKAHNLPRSIRFVPHFSQGTCHYKLHQVTALAGKTQTSYFINSFAKKSYP